MDTLRKEMRKAIAEAIINAPDELREKASATFPDLIAEYTHTERVLRNKNAENRRFNGGCNQNGKDKTGI